MQELPVFVFIFSDCTGGVASFNRNLINHTSLSSACKVKVILIKPEEDKRTPFTDKMRGEVIHFNFSSLENQFHVLHRLYALIGNENGCIITDNALVLNAVSLFGKTKRLIYLVHDYFYVNAALSFANLIDAAVAHSTFFRDVLLAAAVTEYQTKAFFLPYGVELPSVAWQKQRAGETLRLIFLGRLVEEKGVLLLKQIDENLRATGTQAEWTIMGTGPLLAQLKESWSNTDAVKFVQAKDGAEVYKTLEEHDVLVFPSQFEGTPVSIMEAISRGVVPVVSDLPGGTRDMVTDGIGFLCGTRNVEEYANAIRILDQNRQELHLLQQGCLRKARESYDIRKASDAYFTFFFNQMKTPLKTNNGSPIHLSRLDSRYLPNSFVRAFRKAKQKIGW
ncbi:MAG TPA: glycosyltransferase family 4 protein [Flavitalea sp.]|nr:glycosyltransferase family 4 protein [Flavitalea sp.]